MRTLQRLREAAPLLLLAAVLAAVGIARADATERWLRYDTEHFRIIYREADAATAARAIDVAPSVWERTTDFLDYRPDERIPVVIYGDTAVANGYFSPDPPHVALFAAAPAGPWIGARTPDWIEAVFVHEVIHYLHITRPIGLFGSASRALGPLAAAGSVIFLPGWALEGITVAGETRLTDGGRGRNPYFALQWLAPVLDGSLYSFDQAAVESPWAPRGRIYSAGYLMTDYLLDTYGEDTFVDLNREFQRWPFLGMRRAIRRTTGTPADEVYRHMSARLERRYAARAGLPEGTPITPDSDGDWHLLGATERGLAAFHRGPQDAGSIMMRQNGEWRPVAAVTPLDEYSVSVSTDGRLAAAVVVRPDLAGEGSTVSSGDLVLVPLDGDSSDGGDASDDGASRSTPGGAPTVHRSLRPQGPRFLTSGARLYHPAIDATGERIIAVERRGSFSRLVEVDPGSGAIVGAWGEAGSTYAMPSLSPDGTTAAVTENHQGRQSIVILRRGAGGQWRLLRRVDVGGPTTAEYRPVLLGSPLELWFVADDHGLLALYRTTAAAAAPTVRVLVDQVGIVAGVPLNDGTIAYGTYRTHGYSLRVGQPAPTPVTTAPFVATPVAHAPAARPASEQSEPPEAPVPEDVVTASRRFRDLPRPILWYPVAGLTGSSDGDRSVDLGAGVRASSILGRHRLSAVATLNTTAAAPWLDLRYTWQPGPTAWSLGATVDDTLTTRSLSVSGTRPIRYRVGASGYRGLVVRAGATYESVTGSGVSPAESESLETEAAARVLAYRNAAAAQMFGGPGADLVSVAAYRPAILDRDRADLATRTTATAALGSRRRGLRVEPAAAVATSGSGAAVDNLPWTADPFPAEGVGALGATDVAYLGRVALRVPAPALDAVWRGFALRQAGASFFASQAFGDDGTADNYSVAGAQLTADVRFNLIPLQISAGAAVRLPHADTAGSRRVQFFVRLGGLAVDAVGTGRRTARGSVDVPSFQLH